MKLNYLLLLLLTTILTACATAGVPPMKTTIINTRNYDASYDKVWTAIIEVVAESNLGISNLEKDSGIIVISNISYEPSWADEGTLGSAMGVPDEVEERAANFNIVAKRNDNNKISVQINSNFRMYIRHGNGSAAMPFRSKWRKVYSNGTLESLIFDRIAQRL